jgi:carboxymethylenebutenolidase
MGTSIRLNLAEGRSLSAWRADPTGKPRGGVIVGQEIFGVNNHIRSVCERFAQAGYVAIAPALFDWVEPNVELDYSADGIARGRAIMQKISLDQALEALAAGKVLLDAYGRVGLVGYCWGGTLAWAAACRLKGLACAAPFYGGGIAGLAGEQPLCPVELHYGETDHAIPLSDVNTLRAAHRQLPVYLYPAGHGFNCDERASYHADSARLSHERVLALLARCLD